ncbi:DUF5666 domain-containing protein [Ferrimonas balearica]|uniref:DUF5666 domain-containing protein n=1 Tax=Ferrimonas balearica TaxID=44012 RepID=UPI001C5A9E70|nr:DUF5666 domain-containing protein [Ferrimonas balearica]MBW3166444.1 hypothetical protein [Ferrimonas balearica]
MKKLIIPTLMATTLAACGSSSSDGSNPLPPQATLPSAIQGALQKVEGSNLYVNGAKIPASTAQVEMDDQRASLGDLKPGMVLDIDTNGFEAVEVDYDALLKGPVSEVTDSSLVVAGQTVMSAQANQFHSGDFVEVSGHYQAGGIQASFIEGTDDLGLVEVEGQMTNLDTQAKQFNLGQLTVNYANAALDDRLSNGAWVEVEGSINKLTMTATEVDVEQAPGFDEDDSVELEGTISWINDDQSLMTLNQQWQVAIDTQTQFDDGENRSQLKVGQQVEVDGLWQAEHNRIRATEIDIDDQDHDGDDTASSRQFQVEGTAQYADDTLSINGIELVLTTNTQFEDGLNLATLNGSYVQLEGYVQDDQFLVMEVESEQPELSIDLQGPVSANPVSLWGYSATDASLDSHAGQWVDLECRFDPASQQLSACQLDR